MRCSFNINIINIYIMQGSKKNIRVAILGIGNCCSSLYQGLHFYKNNTICTGLMKKDIGGYLVENVEVVLAFDVDKRKVGKSLKYAIVEKPNCTPLFLSMEEMEDGPIVKMGTIMDGVCEITNSNTSNFSPEETFVLSDEPEIKKEEMVSLLIDNKIDILINYLPVGSQKATEYYAECCIESKTSFLNCIPVFIASDPSWEQKFVDANIPIIGDDMKSQFGASVLSQMIQELAILRGHKVKCHIQRNIGGNTDFLNMTDKSRVQSKKISKENVLTSQDKINNVSSNTFFHAGPSEYIAYYKDNKIANFHVELEGFMGSPVVLDAQLSVYDSPNSAGVVIDAIRYLKVARELGLRGSLRGPSSFTQKSPPVQQTLANSIQECNDLANRKINDTLKPQTQHYIVASDLNKN
jgi:myo-inositol-1-phosphate synthase